MNLHPVCHTYTYCTLTNVYMHSKVDKCVLMWNILSSVDVEGILNKMLKMCKKVSQYTCVYMCLVGKHPHIRWTDRVPLCHQTNVIEYKSRLLWWWHSHYRTEGVPWSGFFCSFYMYFDMPQCWCQLLSLFSFPVPGPPVRMVFPEVRLTSVRVVWQPTVFPNGIILGTKTNTQEWAEHCWRTQLSL